MQNYNDSELVDVKYKSVSGKKRTHRLVSLAATSVYSKIISMLVERLRMLDSSQIFPVYFWHRLQRIAGSVLNAVFELHKEKNRDGFDFQLCETHAKTWVAT